MEGFWKVLGRLWGFLEAALKVRVLGRFLEGPGSFLEGYGGVLEGCGMFLEGYWKVIERS